MGFIFAVDSALTMGLRPDGMPADVEGDSRYVLASRIVNGLIKRAKKMNPEPSIALYRTGVEVEKICDDVTSGDLAEQLLKEKNKLLGDSNTGKLLDILSRDLSPTTNDHIIVLTDATLYDGDLNFFAPCETRFVILNTSKDDIDGTQIEELEEVSAESCGYEVCEEDEQYYHLFYYTNNNEEELCEAIASEMFVVPMYTLSLGNISAQFTTSPPVWEDRPFELQVLGFCKSWNLLNLPVVTTHHVLWKSDKEDGEEEDEEVLMEEDSEADDRDQPAPLLSLMLNGMLAEQMTALCRFGSGRYAIVSPLGNEEQGLIISMMPLDYLLPPYIPSIEHMTTGPLVNEQGEDLHLSETDVPASYVANAQSWVTAHGIQNDIQKILRYMKKLPIRIDQFYLEVNKLRSYAGVVGCNSVCEETGRLILEEAATMGDAVMAHARHVAECLKEDVSIFNGAIPEITPPQ